MKVKECENERLRKTGRRKVYGLLLTAAVSGFESGSTGTSLCRYGHAAQTVSQVVPWRFKVQLHHICTGNPLTCRQRIDTHTQI